MFPSTSPGLATGRADSRSAQLRPHRRTVPNPKKSARRFLVTAEVWTCRRLCRLDNRAINTSEGRHHAYGAAHSSPGIFTRRAHLIEAAALAPPGGVGAALGALRFWKPIGIVLAALLGSWMSERYGVGAILLPLAIAQALAVGAALLIHETPGHGGRSEISGVNGRSKVLKPSRNQEPVRGWFPKDAGLWIFVAAMILFHAANAPGGVYLGLFLKRDLHAPDRMLAYAFAVSMLAWMLVVLPGGRLADRWGRKPLLVAAWTIMAIRLALVAAVSSPELAVANQALDGLGNGLFAVVAAAWVTDRLADPRRAGEAQVIVGSCLVFGSAIGPAAASVSSFARLGKLCWRPLSANNRRSRRHNILDATRPARVAQRHWWRLSAFRRRQVRG